MTSMVIFGQVVEAASFSAAAQRLGVAKSTVSKHITKLEDRLGAQLLHRTTRRLSLTEVGRAFYDRCTEIVRQVEEAELAVSQLHAEPRGVIKVNAPMSFGQLRLASAIAEFLARYPNVRIDLALDDRVLNTVEGGFDVTIRVISRLADSSLIARRIAPNRVVVCGAPAYFARHGVPRRPAELAEHNCLRYAYLSSRDDWHFVDAGGEEWVTIDGTLRANNGDVLREAALAGVGLVQMPTFIVGPDLARGTLRSALEAYEDRSLAVWAVYPPTRHLSPKVRAFVDFLVDRFVKPPWDKDVPQRRAREARRAS